MSLDYATKFAINTSNIQFPQNLESSLNFLVRILVFWLMMLFRFLEIWDAIKYLSDGIMLSIFHIQTGNDTIAILEIWIFLLIIGLVPLKLGLILK